LGILKSSPKAALAALLAIGLWGSLASLSTLSSVLPPLLQTGIGLTIGAALAIPLYIANPRRQTRLQVRLIPLGVFGLFGYHSLLFLALASAPSVYANLVNYLWPVLIVLLAPLFLANSKVTGKMLLSVIMGFSGAAIAIVSGSQIVTSFSVGYIFAFLAAIVWAIYSLVSKRVGGFNAKTIGVFAFISGLLALLGHFLFEAPVALNDINWILLIALGIGPLGAAFYLWDYALSHGDPQQVGLLSFLTPLLSTALLLIVLGQPLSTWLALAAGLIVGGAFLGRVSKT
jgi:drug/metabolite transporter (DMT)-like permease